MFLKLGFDLVAGNFLSNYLINQVGGIYFNLCLFYPVQGYWLFGRFKLLVRAEVVVELIIHLGLAAWVGCGPEGLG